MCTAAQIATDSSRVGDDLDPSVHLSVERRVVWGFVSVSLWAAAVTVSIADRTRAPGMVLRKVRVMLSILLIRFLESGRQHYCMV